MRNIWKKDQIQSSETIWRYFKSARFLDFLNNSTLHFSSANQFEDRFEGSVAVVSPEFGVDPRYAAMDPGEKAFHELKRLTKISCWHRASFESDAMWKLYADAHKGVAIRTTVDRFANSIAPFRLREDYGEETLWGGEVRYSDLSQVRISPSMEERFFVKHQAFSWEQEYRFAISLRMAEENGVDVPPDGITVSFNLSDLIEQIILGPHLDSAEMDAIQAKVHASGLGQKLAISTLLYTPRFF